jgi:hypothetical protein
MLLSVHCKILNFGFVINFWVVFLAGLKILKRGRMQMMYNLMALKRLML